MNKKNKSLMENRFVIHLNRIIYDGTILLNKFII